MKKNDIIPKSNTHCVLEKEIALSFIYLDKRKPA